MAHRVAILLFLVSLSCAAPSPVDPPAQQTAPQLPDLGRPDAPLTEAEKKLDTAHALRLAADELAHRENRIEHVIALLRYHWPSAHESAELNVLLAEAHSRVLERLDLGRKEDREPHRRHREAGKVHADAALHADPNRGDAHYWKGAVLLHTAEAESSYGRMKEGLQEMLSAEKLDPRVDHGGPDRMIGRVYQETPGWPFLGSRPKAIEYYKKSIDIAPHFALTHLWLAETYQADGQKDKAREEAGSAANEPPRKGHEKEDGETARKAEELLKKLEGK